MGIVVDLLKNLDSFKERNFTFKEINNLNKIGLYPIIHSGRVVGFNVDDESN